MAIKQTKSPENTPKTQKTTIYLNQKNSQYQNTSYVEAQFVHLA